MNRILLIVNVLLLGAVGYLYYLHYSYTAQDTHNQAKDKAAVLNSFKIAYFELDSLENNYEYYKEVKDYLTKKDHGNAQQLNKLKTDYLNKLKEYQQKGPQLSQNEQSEYEQALMKMQNDYQQTEQSLNTQMQAEMSEKLQTVKMKIQDYLRNYCSKKGLAYVFAASSNDNFLYYKDSIRNITDSVIIGLNQLYTTDKDK